jgi:uncharacterized integral membrane protein (TIGR00698 family)
VGSNLVTVSAPPRRERRVWPRTEEVSAVGKNQRRHRTAERGRLALIPVRRPQWIPGPEEAPGVALAGALGALALGLTSILPRSPVVSEILVALLLGLMVLNTPLRRLMGLKLPGAKREPDRYASGLRYTGKWLLRLAIILLGFKVQTSFFGGTELALIAGVAAAAMPSTFFVAHALGSTVGLRRPLADLLGGGTMICGASAVNAIAPIARAHRIEQGVAIGAVFLFSVVALVAFRPIAALAGLDPSFAGLWSGLAVNDLSSAVAVGAQMGEPGGVMAAASKSARVLLLAPVLVVLALLRREGGPVDVRAGVRDALPRFLLGYLVLAGARVLGDAWLADHALWLLAIEITDGLVGLLMATVVAGIGLHLGLGSLVGQSPRALLVGGGASLWMASLTLAMVVAVQRGAAAAAALVGVVAVIVTYLAYRAVNRGELARRRLVARFESGAPLSLAEATRLLDAGEADGRLDDAFLRRLLVQTHPSIGELIPIRESPLPHGEGCRWRTYWQGRSGWALVALCRDPGAITPIHAHPHRLLGKAIEGVLEELRFRDDPEARELTLESRAILAHEELVETDALTTIHVVRVVGRRPAIDLQLRGPEIGRPGRVLRAAGRVDLETMAVSTRLRVTEELDDRPGHGGEGAGAGWVAPPA